MVFLGLQISNALVVKSSFKFRSKTRKFRISDIIFESKRVKFVLFNMRHCYSFLLNVLSICGQLKYLFF